MREDVNMTNAFFKVPTPVNEPVLPYAPGTKEREAIKSELARQRQTVEKIPLVIGGKHITSGPTRSVRCPHDHKHVLAECHQADKETIREAIAAAEKGRKEWAALPWWERASVFLKAADLLATKYRPIMNAATMLGQSKTVHQAEIDSACELIDFFRFNAHYMTQIYKEQPNSAPSMWNRTEARGLEGFVYAITPFNFTSIALNLPTAPALMGCSVIWKPAATSMHSAWVGMKILEEAGLPDGVINMVSGNSADITNMLLASENLSGIHFTGSTEVFQDLWKTVGNNISHYKTYPRLVGETGGKDFIFAHPSANVEELIIGMVRGAFEFQGQKCSAASRAYIPKSLWAKMKGPLAEMTNSLKMGSPEDFTNFVSAVIDERAYQRITKYIAEARNSAEASIIAGGEYDSSNGYFIRPTIIEVTNPNYVTMRDELFGPVLTVYPYDDNKLEETLEICDKGTSYALTGAIYAKNRLAIHHMTQRLEHAAGNFYINDKPTGAVVGQQPFGGSRASGTNDKAGSMLNLLRWTTQRTIKENFVPFTDYRYPFMSQP
jgi:1-pyrroline-5-carboxylate dehydrogenase